MALRFVRERLFAFDAERFALFVRFYGNRYGAGPERYLRQTFPAWRDGRTAMSGKTENRVLECVPRLLSTADRFHILSLYIPPFEQSLRVRNQSPPPTTAQLSSLYVSTFVRSGKSMPAFDWFVPGVFDDHELAQFVGVIRYAFADRLYQSYAQVREDITRLAQPLIGFDGVADMRYDIAFLDTTIEVDSTWPEMPGEAFPRPQPPTIVSDHMCDYRKIIVGHQLDVHDQEWTGRVAREVAVHDVGSVVAVIRRVAESQVVDSQFNVRAGGGAARIDMRRVNLASLRITALGRIMASAGATVVLAGLAVLVVSQWKNATGLVCAAALPALAVVSGLWAWAGESMKEVKDYEHRRARRFAAAARA